MPDWKMLYERIEGELLCDETSLLLYSTDASIYQVKPKAIVVPRNEKDVVETVDFACKNGIPVIPRGAGSGVAGQAIGEGIIIDFKKYMNRILSYEEGEGLVRVQPGVVYGDLNDFLRKHKKYLPPDPSSGDYCTIGGMVGTNASGAHSMKHGGMSDYVSSLRIVLADCIILQTEKFAVASERFKRLVSSQTKAGEIHSKIKDIIEINRKFIEKNFPHLRFNNVGYAGLQRVFKEECFDLAQLFVGSEGTLGIVTEIVLRVKDIPKSDALLIMHFDSLQKSGMAVSELLRFSPSALEILDRNLLSLARERYPHLDKGLPKNLEVILLAEFDGDEMEDVEIQAKNAVKRISEELRLAFHSEHATTSSEKEKLWEVRRLAVPLLNRMRGEQKFVAFIEDTAVPPEKLSLYFEGLYGIFKKYGVEATVYGHAGKGLLHTRPMLNLKDEEDIEKMKKISEEVFRLASMLGGVISGEHGDGMVRSKYVRRTYGDEIYSIFLEIKKVLDPRNLMNPEKKIVEEDSCKIDRNLRFGSSYRRLHVDKTYFWKQAEFEEEIEACHGCSQCMTTSYKSTMCPMYKLLRDERSSPKSKANVLRSVINGALRADFMPSSEMKEITDYCFYCDSCHRECPSNVNIPKLAMEARAQYYARMRFPLTNLILGNYYLTGRVGTKIAPVANLVLNFFPSRYLLHRIAGIHKDRRLPGFRFKTFEQRFREHRGRNGDVKGERRVAYFAGCFVNFSNPDMGMSFVRLFERLGIEIAVPSQGCNGLPGVANGLSILARRDIQKNISEFVKWVRKGYDVVTTCSSCSFMLKNYWRDFMHTDDSALLSSHTYHFSEYMLMLEKKGEIPTLKFKSMERGAGYHWPCHLKTQPDARNASFTLLSRIPDFHLSPIDKGCCGMAGSFGTRRDDFENSMLLGRDLFLELKDLDFGITDCPTCIMQMEQGTRKKVWHTVEILEKAFQ